MDRESKGISVNFPIAKGNRKRNNKILSYYLSESLPQKFHKNGSQIRNPSIIIRSNLLHGSSLPPPQPPPIQLPPAASPPPQTPNPNPPFPNDSLLSPPPHLLHGRLRHRLRRHCRTPRHRYYLFCVYGDV